MQCKDKDAERSYHNLFGTTLSADSIKGLAMAQMFANIVEKYIEYNGEDEGTLQRGFDLALAHTLKTADAYTVVFNICKHYLKKYWKYCDRVDDIELSDVFDCKYLLINI